jgi:hypothetical protein
MFLAHFFKIYFDIKSIFYTANKVFKYFATSFVAIVMGDKLNITKT